MMEREDVEANGARAWNGATGLGRRIRAAESELSANDRAIGEVILRDPFVAAFSTAEQLGRAVGVSKAAVVRFSVRLGYAGFGDLRQDLRRTWQERGGTRVVRTDPSSSGGPFDPARAIVSARLAHDTASLTSLVEQLDYEAFTESAELLARPGAVVHVVGERRGYAVAAHAFRLLKWLGCDARLFQIEQLGLRHALAEIGPGQVVLAAGFRRYGHLTGVVLEHARQRRGRTILLTENLGSPFVSLAERVLLCPSSGSLPLDSSLSAVFCVEALADLVSQYLGDKVEAHVRRVHDATSAADFEDIDRTAQILRSTSKRDRRALPEGHGGTSPPQ
jgi:DNA-binding MurR/RpiR family transcriptional regulator